LSRRQGTASLEDIERAKDNLLYFIKTAESPYDKNDIKNWLFLIYREARRRNSK